MNQHAPLSTEVEPPLRNDWSRQEVEELLSLPFMELLYRAQSVHRANWKQGEIQLCTLLSIKTGGCAEDCKYCPQSARYDTGLEAERLMSVKQVVANAKIAKASGASRYCMGAAWRNPKGDNFEKVLEIVKQVRALGLETCMTLGMLQPEQAERLKEAGLDYYNHNIDTDPEYYPEVITTRTIDDRLDTLANVREAGINVCSGGIVGMGETRANRAGMLVTLANLPKHPESVPINQLVKVEGTPMADEAELDPFEFIRTIAAARIMMPKSWVRLSAGRETMSDELQALAYMAGANSIFFGPKLLTTRNPQRERDEALFERLGLLSFNELNEVEQGGGGCGACAPE